MLLVLDEPTAALDSLNEKQVARRIQDAVAKSGATLVVLSHSIDFLQEAGIRRVIVLDDAGAIVEDGPLETLISRPESALVRVMQSDGSQFADLPM